MLSIGQQIGPFEIEKELGSGAMGTVFRAKFQRKEDKVVSVALKIVAFGLRGNESAMKRFERESEILKQLRHPHIVRLIATGQYKGTPFIAMEFIDGEGLDQILSRKGKLTWEEVLDYGKQLCEALQYAHEKGIIHRDLKPSNLMVTRDGKLKLTDFGIAKDTDVTALTADNNTIGTAAYMSPEQCKGDKLLTNKSDLYSLGVVFFELLTGRKPFSAGTTVEMFLKHVNEKAPRLSKSVPDLPSKFEALVLQLMEKAKEDRPIDAQWVGRMLAEVEEDQFQRKSAGLALANARTPKPVNQDGERMSAEDKAAARALRGPGSGTKKKKKKPVGPVPLLEQKWLRATALVAILALIVFGAYLGLRAPSAEKLYAAIEKAESPTDKMEAARRYLDAHGPTGETGEKAALAFRNACVQERESQLLKRFSKGAGKPDSDDDVEAFESAKLAMEAEREGQLETAADKWDRVKNRFPTEAKLPYTSKTDELAKARWGWLAEKRLNDLAQVRTERTRVEAKIADCRLKEQAMRTDRNNPESLAIRAVRLLIGFPDPDRPGQKTGLLDPDRGVRACEDLIALTEKESERHVWYLMATQLKSLRRPPVQDPVGERIRRLTAWLNETEQMAAKVKNDPEQRAVRREVRNRCREVTELYDDDPEREVKELVERANKIAKTVPES